MNLRCATLLALVVVFAPSSARAADAPPVAERLTALTAVPGGLTASEAARRAAASSPDVEATRADLAAAAAAVDRAVISYVPRVDLGARYTRLSAIDPPLLGGMIPVPVRFNQTSFQATVSLPLSDYLLRISRAHAAAAEGRAAAEHHAEAARRQARATTRLTYWGWARARLSRVVTEAAVAQARLHLTDLQKAQAAGVASKADVMRVESQLASAEQLDARTAHLAQALETRLRTALHDPPGTTYAIGEPLAAPAPAAPVASLDPDRLADEAAAARPELRALAATTRALEREAAVARAGLYPQLAAAGEVTTANPNPRFFLPEDRFDTTWSVGASLAWSPTAALDANAAGRSARQRAAAADARRRQALDAVRVEVADAVQAVRDAAAARAASERGLAAAEESYRARRAQFQGGRATSVELTDAEVDLTRARLDALAARIDTRVAEVQLLRATGRDGD